MQLFSNVNDQPSVRGDRLAKSLDRLCALVNLHFRSVLQTQFIRAGDCLLRRVR